MAINRDKARMKLEEWIEKSYSFHEEMFHTAASTIINHLENILNYFEDHVTKAFAESFNSKIKRFRFNQRGLYILSLHIKKINLLSPQLFDNTFWQVP